MSLLNDEQRKEFFKLSVYPPHTMSIPGKREFRRGAEAAFLGRKRDENPWNASWQRRNMGAYAGAWWRGFDAATEAMKNDS